MNCACTRSVAVDEICTEFDPESLVREWFKDHASSADWQTWIEVERAQLRACVEVAILVGKVLDGLGYPWRDAPEFPPGTPLHDLIKSMQARGVEWARDEDVRMRLFYKFNEELTCIDAKEREQVLRDNEVRLRGDDNLGREGGDSLSDIMYETWEAACRRAAGDRTSRSHYLRQRHPGSLLARTG